MGLFHVVATDRADGIDIRKANRTAHLDWAADQSDWVLMAGPVSSADGSRMEGSVFIVRGDSEDHVRVRFESDPYVKARLFSDVKIKPFKWVIGRPDGLQE